MKSIRKIDINKIIDYLESKKIYLISDFLIGLKNIKKSKTKKKEKIFFDMYFGVPGSGKTTFAAWLVRRDLRKNKKVFSNLPIVGAYKISREEIGIYQLENCHLILDEVGIEYSNRDFKSFKKEENQFFKLHRHYKVSVSMFSQAYNDADKKLRDLATRYYVVEKSLIPFFVVRRRLCKRVGIDNLTKQIIDEYYYSIFGRRWIFSPSLWHLFNSYDAPKLKYKEYEKYEKINTP